MRKVNWWQIAGTQRPASVFELDKYADTVEKKLAAEGYIGLAEEVKALIQKFHAAQAAEISALIKGEA